LSPNELATLARSLGFGVNSFSLDTLDSALVDAVEGVERFADARDYAAATNELLESKITFITS
jgi:hypothetical protein